MDWTDTCRDLDDYLANLPDPTDDDLRAIDDDPIDILSDEELMELLEALLEDV